MGHETWKFPFQRLTPQADVPSVATGCELTQRGAAQAESVNDGLDQVQEWESSSQNAVPQVPIYQQKWVFLVLWCALSVIISYADRTNISIAILDMQDEFKWDEQEKGLILSIFFIGYALTQIVGGHLADQIGGKSILACGLAVWSLCTFLTPVSAKMGMGVLLINRIALGLGEGVGFPAIHSIISGNVPSRYQSTAVGIVTAACYGGTVFAYSISPWITKDFGWEVVFYSFGVLAILWLPPWAFVTTRSFNRDAGCQSAQVQTQKSSMERPGEFFGYSSLLPGKKGFQKDTGVLALLKTKPVIAMCIAMYCQSWGNYTLINWLPTFFNEKYGIHIEDVGWYTILPYIMQATVGSVAGIIADFLLARKWSVKTVRRLFQSFGMIGPAVCLTLAVSSVAPASAMQGSVLLSIGMGLAALTVAGVCVTHLDIAPNHAGAIFGVANTVATAAGFGVYVAGWLLNKTHSWGWVFGVTVLHYLVGIIVWISWVGGSPLPQDKVASTFPNLPGSKLGGTPSEQKL